MCVRDVDVCEGCGCVGGMRMCWRDVDVIGAPVVCFGASDRKFIIIHTYSHTLTNTHEVIGVAIQFSTFFCSLISFVSKTFFFFFFFMASKTSFY